MAQKIIRIGSSVGVTIPKDILEQLGMRVGDIVRMDASHDHRRITIETAGQSHNKIDPRLIEWTDSFIKNNRTLLDRLSQK